MNIITGIAAIITLVVAGAAFSGWLVMLFCGVVGSVFAWEAAAQVSFFDAVAVAVLFGLVKGLFTLKGDT